MEFALHLEFKKIPLLISVLAIFVFSFTIPSKSDFIYDPLFVLLEAPNGSGSASVKLTNPTDKSMRIEVNLDEWEISENNDVKTKPLPEKSEDSILNYVKISPKQFTLEPNQKKVIRIFCSLPNNFPDKEYKLFLKMKELGADRKELIMSGKPANMNFGVMINKQINAGFYILKGNQNLFKSNLQIKDIKLKKESDGLISYSITYQNLGKVHTRKTIGLRIYDSKGASVGDQANIGSLIAFPTEGNKTITVNSNFRPSSQLSSLNSPVVEMVFSDRFDAYLKDKGSSIIGPKATIKTE